jgi:demethylmenaquinone methyltransferase / 2-methoxy-6-polyprenyl-1,4-benzoquinol methylase
MTTQTNARALAVRAMFGRIARRYDLMNALMTFGMDRKWRARTADAVLPQVDSAAAKQLPRGWPADASRLQRPVLLDAGAGTGDLALALIRRGAASVIAADLTEPMLLEAQKKLATDRIRLVAADATALPFPDASFDGVTNGFLLRNVADLPAVLREFSRVLKPGGRLACLEITHPPRSVAPIFRPYFEGIVPLLGRLVSGDAAAYAYLPASVRPFPKPDELVELLRQAGFSDVSYRRLSIGVVALHVATKPG